MIDPEIKRRIDAHKFDGRYAEAANLHLAAGDPVGAAQLYADVWQYDDAIRIAEGAGLYDVAYRHALTARERGEVTRLLGELAERPEQALRGAEIAEARGCTVDAARLREAGGDIAAAAALYEQAGEHFDAGRCYEEIGEHRKAGVLYERRVRVAPDDGESALRLGRILAQFGRYEHAVRALQKAAADPDREGGAVRLMTACFAAMAMEEAAASCLDRLRRDDPALPVTVPEFLKESFGDERGLSAIVEQGEAATLLAGRYRILRPLGAGATGRVLLAHDGFYDRDVAIKVLTVGSGAAGRDAFVRFAREARVAAGLEHPNVVRVFEFNPDGPFLVMEHMEGGTLEDRLVGPGGTGKRLSPPVVRHVMISILDGLSAVHRRGVVHRDLKPANVFFGAAGDVKIGDFGVAHLTDLGATLTGAMLGTLAYMAPEQITGEKRPDASTDLYAVGILLFRALTGELPFPGPDFLTQHLEREPARPSVARPALGDGFDELVLSLLKKQTADRPRSAEEVRAWVERLAWPAEDGGGFGALEPSPEEKRPSSAPPPSGDEQRYRELRALAGGAFLAHDAIVDRPVVIEPCDAARADRLRGLARGDGPHLQAIFDLTESRAVLEQPTGVLLSQATLSAEARERVIAHVRAALDRLHATGTAHGAVAPERILVGPGRAVLLLPDGSAEATAAADLAALAAL